MSWGAILIEGLNGRGGNGLIKDLVKQSSNNTRQISGKFRCLDQVKKDNQLANKMLSLANKYRFNRI